MPLPPNLLLLEFTKGLGVWFLRAPLCRDGETLPPYPFFFLLSPHTTPLIWRRCSCCVPRRCARAHTHTYTHTSVLLVVFFQPGTLLLTLPVPTRMFCFWGHCWMNLCHGMSTMISALLGFCFYLSMLILERNPKQKVTAEINAMQTKDWILLWVRLATKDMLKTN